MRSRTTAYILTTIKNLEREFAFLKSLVQQAISEDDEAVHEDIIVDATFFDTEDAELATEATVIDDCKPAARRLTLKEQRDEGRKKAKAWAKAQKAAKLKRL
jgi:hypothetical protein